MEEINYSLIVVSAIAAIASPGPATLTTAGTSMSHGRRFGNQGKPGRCITCSSMRCYPARS